MLCYALCKHKSKRQSLLQRAYNVMCCKGGDTCTQKGFGMNGLTSASMFGSGLILVAAGQFWVILETPEKKKEKSLRIWRHIMKYLCRFFILSVKWKCVTAARRQKYNKCALEAGVTGSVEMRFIILTKKESWLVAWT